MESNMLNRSFLRSRLLGHRWLVTLCPIFLLLAGYLCVAQTAVILSPVPRQQFFDANGKPLAFGCLFSYQSNTTTPLATYTDYTGSVQNTNPLILGADGRVGTGGIWLSAGLAYRIDVKSSGGTNCALGSTISTVNGIGGGSTVLTTIVPYSPTPSFTDAAQIQLFKITLTGNASAQPLTFVGVTPPGIVIFEITQDGSGGHSFSWPANLIGGAPINIGANQVSTQIFLYDGSGATAMGPGMIGAGPSVSVGNLTANGVVVSPLFESTTANIASAGTIRLANTDTILWRNFGNSANYGIGADASDRGLWSFAGGLELTGANPNIALGGVTASFPGLFRSGAGLNVGLADGSGDAVLTASTLGVSGAFAVTGPEVSTPAAPASSTQKGYFKAGKGWCAEDSGSHEFCTAAGSGVAVQASSITLLGSPVDISDTAVHTILTKAVTMPAAGCPCRAFVSYGINLDTNSAGEASATVFDATNRFATGSMNTTGSASQFAIQASSYSTGTYANSASITFTLQAQATNGGSTSVHVNNGNSLGQASYLNVAIFTSN